MLRALESLDPAHQEKLRHEMVRLWSAHNKGSDGTTLVEAEYLEVRARRN
jgi:hypothetical protein